MHIVKHRPLCCVDLPVLIVEIVLVERTNELFELLLYGQQINLISILLVVWIEIVRKKYTNIVETFHFRIYIFFCSFVVYSRCAAILSGSPMSLSSMNWRETSDARASSSTTQSETSGNTISSSNCHSERAGKVNVNRSQVK